MEDLAKRMVKLAGESGDEKTGVGYAFGEYVRDALIRSQPFFLLQLWFRSLSSAQLFAKSLVSLAHLAFFQVPERTTTTTTAASTAASAASAAAAAGPTAVTGLWWEEMARERSRLKLALELKNKKRIVWNGGIAKPGELRLVVRDVLTGSELDMSIHVRDTFPLPPCDLNLLCFDGDAILSADEVRFPVKILRRMAELSRATLLREYIQMHPPETVELVRQKLLAKGFAINFPPVPSHSAPVVPSRPFIIPGPDPAPTSLPPRSPPFLSTRLHQFLSARLATRN